MFVNWTQSKSLDPRNQFVSLHRMIGVARRDDTSVTGVGRGEVNWPAHSQNGISGVASG